MLIETKTNTTKAFWYDENIRTLNQGELENYEISILKSSVSKYHHILSNSAPWGWQKPPITPVFMATFTVGSDLYDLESWPRRALSPSWGPTHRLQKEKAAKRSLILLPHSSFIIDAQLSLEKGSQTFRWCVWWIFQLTNRPPDTRHQNRLWLQRLQVYTLYTYVKNKCSTHPYTH